MDLILDEVLLSTCLFVPLLDVSIGKNGVIGLEVFDLGGWLDRVRSKLRACRMYRARHL
jgi:hypothetical protein